MVKLTQVELKKLGASNIMQAVLEVKHTINFYYHQKFNMAK